MSAPSVSVIIPAYNHGAYLREAVTSVLEQAQDLDVLVIDDGSTDGTADILQELGAREPRLRVLTHPGRVNRGLHASLELGVATARGEVLGFLASDDRWHPNFLEHMLPPLEHAGAAYGRVRLVDVTGEPTGVVWGHPAKYGRSLFQQLLISNVIPTGAIVIRADALRRAGGIMGSEQYEDLDVMLRLAATTEVAYVDQVVADYRTGTGGRQEQVIEQDRERLSYISTVRHVARWRALPWRRRREVRTALEAWSFLLALTGEGPLPRRVRGGPGWELKYLCEAHLEGLSRRRSTVVEALQALAQSHPRHTAEIRSALGREF